MTADESPLGRLVARALGDAAFKERLLTDPAGVLAQAGVALPEGVTVRVVEDTGSVRHLVLPAAAPALTDDELDPVVGGTIPPHGCGIGPNAMPGLQ